MYILLALQLISNPGHYIWSQVASFQTADACYNAIHEMIQAEIKLEGRENFICVTDGTYSVTPYQPK